MEQDTMKIQIDNIDMPREDIDLQNEDFNMQRVDIDLQNEEFNMQRVDSDLQMEDTDIQIGDINRTDRNETSNSLNLEEEFMQLESLINQLEQEDISLQDSFQLYSRGMESLKNCMNMITDVEKQIQIIDEQGE